MADGASPYGGATQAISWGSDEEAEAVGLPAATAVRGEGRSIEPTPYLPPPSFESSLLRNLHVGGMGAWHGSPRWHLPTPPTLDSPVLILGEAVPA